MTSFDVRDEALAQLGLAVAQAHIDKALLAARLTKAKEIVESVLQSVQWVPVPGAEGERQVPVFPDDMLATLQGVVTSL